MINKQHVIYNKARLAISLAATGFILGLVLCDKANAHVDLIEPKLGFELEMMIIERQEAKEQRQIDYLIAAGYVHEYFSESSSEPTGDSGWLGSSHD